MFPFRSAKNAFSSPTLPNRREILASVAALAIPNPPPLQLGIIGTGVRGVSLLRTLLRMPNAAVTAVCDLEPENAARAAAVVSPSPAVFSGHAEAYKKLLDRKDVSAVLIATPEPLHAQMAIDSLRAGKCVLSEVAAATSIEDCWRLIEAVEATRGFYMMAENCCYYPQNLMVANMVSQGLFGDLTLAECGYVHRLLERHFTTNGDLSWRGQLATAFANWYPTHAVGPVAQWFGINKGDRFATIASAESPSTALRRFAEQRFPQNTKSINAPFHGDSTVSVLKTASGRIIINRFDVSSTRPTVSTTYFTLQGSKGSYRDVEGEIKLYLEGRSPIESWETPDAYDKQFGSPLWKEWGTAAEAAEHGGSDYITLASFIRAVQQNAPSPINIYDSATWSAVIPLSTESAKQRFRPLPFPDFTRGRWR